MVRIGTIFEESKIPLCKWQMAIHLMTSSKKGVSSHQIARECDITQKSAWFLNHRIREAMRQEPMATLLTGTVEADEVYMGGKSRLGKWGRGSERKTPVLVLVERNGHAHAASLERADGKSIREVAHAVIDPTAIIHSDEWGGYKGIGREFGGHKVVNHRRKQYVRKVNRTGEVITTNTAESFNALMKRRHYGIFHQYSKQHLHRYCNEFSSRWSHRRVSDGERMIAAIRGAEGKRLMYS